MNIIKTSLVLVASLFLLAGCDVEVEPAPDVEVVDVWPGADMCWFRDSGGADMGVCCFADGWCGYAHGSVDRDTLEMHYPLHFGCYPTTIYALGGGDVLYECDEDCNCVYPEPGVGATMDLPFAVPDLATE